jgi:protein-disulfide isomerase
MRHMNFLFFWLAAGMAQSALAQATPAPAAPQNPAPLSLEQQSPDLARHIGILLHSRFNVPEDYEVKLGARGPSTVAGFDTLPITLTREGHGTTINFLLSTDNQTLARLESFSLTRDPVFSINVEGRPVRGNPQAKVTVVNFDDLECPVCARVHHELFPALLERYKNRVRLVYKDNPLTEIHPWALRAAVDADCLAAQSGDAYWAYVDYVHSNGQQVNGAERSESNSFATLDRIARQEAVVAKLDSARLDACLATQDEAPVRASMKEAELLGLNFAPAIYINGERISGYIPPEQVEAILDRALSDAGVTPLAGH